MIGVFMSVGTKAFGVRRLSKVAVGALLLAVGFGSWAQADVRSVAPSDSLGVFQVKNIGATSKKVGDLVTKLGLAAFKPEMADPLGAFKTEMKITKGLKEDGEFGVILLPASAWPAQGMAAGDKPGVVVLVPVTNYDDFISNFEGATKDGDITSIEKDGKPSYVMKWGDYAAVTPVKEHLALKGTGVKVNAAADKEFSSKDAVFWANIPAINAAFGSKLEEQKPKMLSEVDAKMSADPKMATYAPVAKAVVSQFIAAGQTFLKESTGATLSWNLTDVGINSSVATEFAEGSYLGTWTKSLKSSKQSFTEGLPPGAYLFFGGVSLDGTAVEKLVRDFVGPIMDEAKKIDGVGPDAQKTLDALLDSLKSVKLTNFGMLAPKGGLGQESLVQLAYYVKGDSKKYLAAMKSYGESYAKALEGLQGSAMMPFKMTYKPANKTVDGVTFDTLDMALDPNPKTPEEAQMAQMMTMIYGPNGLSYNAAAINDSTAILYAGLPDASVSKLIASAKAGSDDLGKLESVKRTAKQLPDAPVGQFYIALDEIVKTGVNAARQFNVPVNIQLPNDLSPIGASVDADGTVLRFDSHVPTELVQSLVAAYIMMQGGNGGGF